MFVFKGIHIYNQYGILATAMYLRDVEKNEIEVSALGAHDDTLDDAIIAALKSQFTNCRFYDTTPIEGEQLEDFKSNYKGEKKVVFNLLLINKKVNSIDLIVRLNEDNPESRNVKHLTIKYKNQKEIIERQMNTLKVL
jgi:hypothetical protein